MYHINSFKCFRIRFFMAERVKKYVLTGGSRAGKTAVLLALEQMGEAIMRSAASDLIKLEQARGVKEPWKEVDFQRRIFDLQRRREGELEDIAKNQRVFIDRGLIDGTAYCQLEGTYSMLVSPTRIMRQITPYEAVFLIKDIREKGDRRESVKEALEIEELQLQNYRACGYKPIVIRKGKVDDRAREILRHVNP